MANCAYLFLDEGGNFDFSSTGTRYFILTSVATQRPFPAHASLDDFKQIAWNTASIPSISTVPMTTPMCGARCSS